ncbi:MAG: hypothetical protein U0167_10110 [bacterium]
MRILGGFAALVTLFASSALADPPAAASPSGAATTPAATASTTPTTPPAGSAPAASTTPPKAPAAITVTYVTATSAYLDAGAEAGLHAGDALEVVRDGKVIAHLEITAVSSTRAVGRRVEADVELQTGDRVRPRGGAPLAVPPSALAPSGAPPAEAAPSVTPRTGPPRKPWLRRHGMRGHVDLRYLGLVDQSPLNAGYSEPAVDVRLDADVASELHVSVDARARRTYRLGEETGRSRVYRLITEWTSGPTGPHAVFGRQLSSSLASVSVFDGALAEWRGAHWNAGAFSGTQPDPVSYGFSTAIREHGVFGEFGSVMNADTRWRFTMAAIGSYGKDAIDREYVAVNGRASSRRFDLYALQEVDVNRGWKKDLGEKPVSLTSALVTGRLRFTDKWSVSAGSDTRRSVRLYRDRVTPETEFDDAYRTGSWGGIELRPTVRTSVAADARRSSGGTGGTSDSYTLRGGIGLPSLRNLGVHARGTSYSNSLTRGWLGSGDITLDVTSALRLGTSAGLRRENPTASGLRDDIVWVSGDLDLTVSSSWLLLGSVEETHGDLQKTLEIQGSAIYRF